MECARFAGEQASALELDALKHLLANQRAAKTPAEAAFANRQLHDAIARAAHNEYLLRAMNVLTDALALLGETTYTVPGRMTSGLRENRSPISSCACPFAWTAPPAEPANPAPRVTFALSNVLTAEVIPSQSIIRLNTFQRMSLGSEHCDGLVVAALSHFR